MSSPEEVFEVIEEGKSNRHIAVTSRFFSIPNEYIVITVNFNNKIYILNRKHF